MPESCRFFYKQSISVPVTLVSLDMLKLRACLTCASLENEI